MEITKDNECCHNETAVAKLRNQLSPHYGLPEMILALDKHPKMKELIIEQAKQAQANKARIDELLVEIESESHLKTSLDQLSDNARLEIMSNYCQYCGSDNPSCQCWNDE